MKQAALFLVLLSAVALALPAGAGQTLAKPPAGKGRPGKLAQPAKPPLARRNVRPGTPSNAKPPGRATAAPIAKPPPRSGAKPGPRPAVKLASKPSAQPAPRNARQVATKRGGQSVPHPAAKPIARPAKPVAKPVGRSAAKPAPSARSACAKPRTPPRPPPMNEAPKPSAGDPDRERLELLQEALDEVVHGKVLGRLRVGLRVEQLSTGRLLYGWRSSVLMDPASNQKVLATTAALLRLGNRFRFRTEVTGQQPDAVGAIRGDLVLRGSGDPSLRLRHIEELAQSLAASGVSRVTGAVLGDPRRIGSEEGPTPGRSPLRVGGTSIEIRVRPGERVGGRAVVSVLPDSDAFVVVNQTETRGRGRAKLSADVTRAGGRFQVTVAGKVSIARGEAVIYRAPPSHPLFAAVLLRHALVQAGIVVEGPAGLFAGDEPGRVASDEPIAGSLLALSPSSSDVSPPLAARDRERPRVMIAMHQSASLPVLLRRVNKQSDNEWAERVLDAVGAEVLGGAATTGKGLRVLRDSLTDIGLPASAYLPANGSGLGHRNRVTAAGMAQLLRRLYFDPRVGPEIMQSLSVGGVDGTTRNRFRGTSAAHRVRAKTGTLNGVSCLSGFVGDGSDVLAFSILVEGHRRRAVSAVRSAQVSAVNAMMRFAQQTSSVPAADDEASGIDYETGDEVDEPEAPAGAQ